MISQARDISIKKNEERNEKLKEPTLSPKEREEIQKEIEEEEGKISIFNNGIKMVNCLIDSAKTLQNKYYYEAVQDNTRMSNSEKDYWLMRQRLKDW